MPATNERRVGHRAARSPLSMARNVRNLYRAGQQANRVYKKVKSKYFQQGEPTRADYITTRTSPGVRTALKSKQKFKRRRVKTVTVPKKLRKQVKKVIASDTDHQGTFVTNYRIQGFRQSVIHKKDYFGYPMNLNGSLNPGPEFNGAVFTWNAVLDAASKLWNTKPAEEFPLINSIYNFNPQSAEIEVQYQSCKYWITNNTTRTYFVTMLKCTSKDNQPKTLNGGYNSFLRQFELAYNEEVSAGSMAGFTVLGSDSNRITRTEWKNKPQLLKQMRKCWKMEEIKMVIQPGQVVEQTVLGPVGKMCGTDFYVGDLYQDFHKGSVFTFFSILPDLVEQGAVGTDGTPGYFRNPASDSTTNGTVIFEASVTRKLKMPEQTGFITDTIYSGGVAMDLELRKGRYKFEGFDNAPSPGEIRKTSVMNPEFQDLGTATA